MDESPFQTHADILINGWDASARCLQSFVLSMQDGDKYMFSARDLYSLSEGHYSIFCELAQYFRSEGADDPHFKEVCRRMIELRPDYTQVPSGLYPFPDPEFVFVSDQADLSRHLHPLFGIDLNIVNPEWSGCLFMLSPLEPAEHQLVGSATEDTGYHSELLHTNWIGFKVENGKYRLIGDPRYFFLHEDNVNLPDPYPYARSELVEYYEQQNAAFAAARDAYNRTGKLFWPDGLIQGLKMDGTGIGVRLSSASAAI